MPFGDDNFQTILPPYLVDPDKSRLRDALKQFTPEQRGKEINYSDFYRDYTHNYFLQSDLIREVRFAKWNEGTSLYDKAYTDAIIVSNTCDISEENNHELNCKQCLFAPVIDFNEYLDELAKEGYSQEKIQSFKQVVASQLRTNIFFLPRNHKDDKEYIVLLDNIFWFPTSELNSYLADINANRIVSLSLYGYYLFILKLSYHLCRLPEQCDREFKVEI